MSFKIPIWIWLPTLAALITYILTEPLEWIDKITIRLKWRKK